MIKELQKETKKLGDKERAIHSQRFFKTGKEEYGEDDIFYGLTNQTCHLLANKYKELPIEEIRELIKSKIHEERLIALLILVELYKKSDEKTKEKVFRFYLKHTKYINNWDLVDLSAHKIIGNYLQGETFQVERVYKGFTLLKKLAKSKSLWDRRIAIISTFAYISKNNPKPTLEIAKILLHDSHDLIHKAVGWALREVGKRCGEDIEREFLDKYAVTMPRTMLRYAIERFDKNIRHEYLQIKQRAASGD